MVVDVGVVRNYIKPKADTTLYNMRKDDLIEYIRTLEHNYNVAVSFNENQAKYIESLGFNRVVQKWIPVTEGMPKLIPCDAGTAYSEAVNVLTSGRKVLTAIWDGFDWTCDAEFWDAEDEEITHWTPVLLPLPEPPKGE